MDATARQEQYDSEDRLYAPVLLFTGHRVWNVRVLCNGLCGPPRQSRWATRTEPMTERRVYGEDTGAGGLLSE